MAQKIAAENKTFVITGGASGLGARYVETLLGLGAKSIAVLDIAEDVGKATVERLNKIHNDKVLFIKCDMSKEEDITNAFEHVLKEFKQIDVIINNAGIMNDAPSIWRTSCDVNWQGSVSLTFKGVKHMRKDEGGNGGTIINISSTAALVRLPFVPTYMGSKIAVLHFSQCISMDPFFEETGVRVLTICFGVTDTPILRNLESRSYEPKLGHVFAQKITKYQKVESAVAAFIHVFENGAPGSVWLSVKDKPVKDITPDIKRVFDELGNLMS